ncbi:recombinase family protein [Pseudoalteromonas spongiae]|jgi:DNA invertase Pin-like site-specific DNA recombinase|uniref:recombinase family protein n=1 Tax=Pseudoalteromonas spongiae TaxID=298657 RepID=UPI000C8B9C17|nr:recombinase family protein [Pseudoalteromonas spongiae]MAD98317.1 resolvase [Flavobacteriaceae bacterium]TMO88898.1 resolvase [Pseudoalteromonas spongiae]|tara:strand:- start:7491 stop:8078 length:588 start_codon:yes stop_codon:yes gene_type:complete
MKVGFARVSTKEQDLNVQLSKLDAHGCEKIFQGKQSGSSVRNEEKLKELIDFIREGDEVIVTRLDRLGRSLKSILEAIESIHKKGACLNIIDGSLNTGNDNPFSTAMINLCGVFAQLERDLIKARTAEGREEAKAKGKHMGRMPALSDKQAKELYKDKLNGDSISALARKYGVGRPTVHRTLERVAKSATKREGK